MPDKVNGQEVKDSIVLLGDKKQDKQMENVLRILETPDRENPGSTVRIITNDFEHFFESLKAFIRKINRPLSRSSKGRRVIDYEKSISSPKGLTMLKYFYAMLVIFSIIILFYFFEVREQLQ